MRLRAHRRNLVVWSSSAARDDRTGAPAFIRASDTGRMHRLVRTGALVAVVSLLGLARALRPRWRQLLPGLVLTVAGLMMRGSPWGVFLLPGLLLLLSIPLVPVSPDAGHRRLERELAAYSTQAQRRDLEATLDRYPDSDTHELRDILAGQVITARGERIPGAGPSPARP
jgi:hypothetical protein